MSGTSAVQRVGPVWADPHKLNSVDLTVFTATGRLRAAFSWAGMASLETIRRIKIETTESGADAVSAKLGKLADAQQGVAVASDRTEKATLSQERALNSLQRRYDPMIRIEQDLAKVERTLNAAREQGLVTQARQVELMTLAEAQINRTAKANDNLAAAQKAAAQAAVNKQTIVPDRSSDVAAYAKSLDDLRAKYNPLFAAGRGYKAALTEINQAAKVGAISEAERVAALDRTKSAFVDQVARIRAASSANDNLSKSTAAAGYQIRNLGFQLNDVASGLATGQSPFTILAQQGGQIGQILGETGVSGAVKGVGSAIASVITPGRLIGTVLVTAGVAAFAAWSRLEGQQREIGATLQGLGRIVGGTTQQFEQMGARAAEAGRLSVATATETANALARTGELGAGNIERFTALQKNIAATFTGNDLSKARDMMVRLAEDPQKGFEQLNKQLHFLDVTTQDYVKSLFQQGKQQEAIAVILDRLPSALASYSQSVSAFGHGWEVLTRQVSDAGDALGRYVDKAARAVNQGRPSAPAGIATNGSIDNPNFVPAQAEIAAVGTAAATAADGVAKLREAFGQAAAGGETYLDKAKQLTEETGRLTGASNDNSAAVRKQIDFYKDAMKDLGETSPQLREMTDVVKGLDAALGNNPGLADQISKIPEWSAKVDKARQYLQSFNDENGRYVSEAQAAAKVDELRNQRTLATTNAERQRLDVLIRQAEQRGVAQSSEKAMNDQRQAAVSIAVQEKAQLQEMNRDQDAQIALLQRQSEMIGMTAAERNRALAVMQAEQDLVRAGITLHPEEQRAYVEKAARIADLTTAYQRAQDAQRLLQEGQRAIAQDFSNFAQEMITGSGKLEDAFKTLGKSFTNNAINSLLTGSGPLAGIMGTAPTEKGGVGGIMSPQFFDKMSKAVSEGTSGGFSSLFGGGAANDNTSWGGLTDKDFVGSGAGGLSFGNAATGVVGLAAAYGVGRSSGNQTQGMIGGALSGAMAGAPLGPLGIAAGGAIGAALAFFGANDAEAAKKKQQRQQAIDDMKAAAEAMTAQLPQIYAGWAAMRGEVKGGAGQAVASARADTEALIGNFKKAGWTTGIPEAERSLQIFIDRTTRDFLASFNGFVDALTTGMGPSSPFTQAQANVKSMGEALKGFLADTREFGGDIGQATAASQDYALSLLTGSKTLSLVGTRMAEINGTAAGLQQVLQDLRMSADQAAEAIKGGVTAALNDLRNTFETDLRRQINDAVGQGYLNDAADLIARTGSLRQDATALGADPALIDRFFAVSAQKIVDGAQLAGDAFQALITHFPALTGVVHEFVAEVVPEAEKAAEALKRTVDQLASAKQSLGDRLFNATNDPSTLFGAIAAQERQFAQERLAEERAGGELLLDLQETQLAERLRLLQDFSDKAAEAEKQRYEEARNFLDSFARTIKDFISNLKTGAQSPLSPQARLSQAQADYNAQLTLAQGGNRDAMSSITTYATNLLEAGKAFYASSAAFQTIFSTVTSQLGALPTQVSPEQLIVNAIDAAKVATVDATTLMKNQLSAAVQSNSPALIASALSSHFNTLDANVNGLLDFNEFKAGLTGSDLATNNGKLQQIFTELDVNGDGQISRLELLRASSDAGNVKIDNQTGWIVALKNVTDALKAVNDNQLTWLTFIKGANDTQIQVIAAVRDLAQTNNNLTGTQTALLQTSQEHLAIIRDANTQGAVATFGGNFTVSNNMLTALNKIVANTYAIATNTVHANNRAFSTGNSNPVPSIGGTFAEGGWVNGPGTGTSDSINAMLSNGEFVVRADAAAALRPFMEDINRGRLPVMPVPYAGNDNSALVAEIRGLRAEVAEFRRENSRAIATASQYEREGTDRIAGAIDEGNRDRVLRRA
jgi:Ca2+-binding EF-hand superfamily protein